MRRGLLVGVLLLTAACAREVRWMCCPLPPLARPSELLTVLPHSDGTTGAVSAVTPTGAEYLLDTPYVTLSQTPEGGSVLGVRSPDEIQALFGAALQGRPLPPLAFGLYFAFGTDTLTAASAKDLQRIVAEVARYPAPDIVLIGHTDQVGSDPDNDALSLQRAERVRQELIQQGVAADIISTVARGKREATGVAAKDRRVDVILR